MSTNNNKLKPLSATSFRNMAVEKSCSSKPTRTSNPEPNTLSDQHNMLSETSNVLTGYTFFFFLIPKFKRLLKEYFLKI